MESNATEVTAGRGERVQKEGKLRHLGTCVLKWSPVIIAAGGIAVSYHILKNQEDHFAWQTISSQKPGNSGLGGALKHLHDQGVSLSHAVLEPGIVMRSAAAQSGNQGNLQKESRIPKAYVEKGVNLEKIDLSHSWLGYTNFGEVVMNGANLRRTKLDEADFTGTHLNKAKLSEAEGTNTTLSKAMMREAEANKIKLYDATALDAEFDESDFTDSVLLRILALGASFKKTKLNDAKLIEARIQSAAFNYAELREADLTGAHAEYAEFTGADLTEASLKNANLKGAELKWVCLAKAKLENTILDEANAVMANFTDANLEGASMINTNFKGSNVSGIKISDAVGIGAAVWDDAWIWNDRKPNAEEVRLSAEEKMSWREVVSHLIIYKTDCRDQWLQRIQNERNNGTEDPAASLYRAPEDNSCRITYKAGP